MLLIIYLNHNIMSKTKLIDISKLKTVDYRLQGYHQKITNNVKGDVSIVEYYANYDSNTNTYSDLKVKETKLYTRDNVLGIPQNQIENIEWFENDESVASKMLTKYYTVETGYVVNKKAAKILINKASMYLALLLVPSGRRT